MTRGVPQVHFPLCDGSGVEYGAGADAHSATKFLQQQRNASQGEQARESDFAHADATRSQRIQQVTANLRAVLSLQYSTVTKG